jgi:hypothetical protein
MPIGTFSALSERVANLTKELEALKEEVRALRRALWTFGLGILSAAVIFFLALTLNQ